jgi:hypothetical protein
MFDPGGVGEEKDTRLITSAMSNIRNYDNSTLEFCLRLHPLTSSWVNIMKLQVLRPKEGKTL